MVITSEGVDLTFFGRGFTFVGVVLPLLPWFYLSGRGSTFVCLGLSL